MKTKDIISATDQAQKFMDTYPQGDNMLHLEDKEKIAKLIREFAKWHVKAALKEASEKAEMDSWDEKDGCSINKDSILNSYPVDKIK